MLPMDKIAEFCRRWKIQEMAVFGSALRADFSPESDIDVIVAFDDTAEWSLLDHIRMQQELQAILQRDVDLVTRRAIETKSELDTTQGDSEHGFYYLP
jgi:predicted nucleotidyltransferase